MHLRIETKISLIVLTIIDLCFCVPNLTDQITINSNNGKSMFKNKNYQFNLNGKHPVIDESIDDNIRIDNSEQKEIHRKLDASSVPSSSEDYVDAIDHPNFLITNYLSDGEIERRIHFNGITAKETLVSNAGRLLSLWQLSYRDTFIQMIHSNNDKILDCDILKGWNFNEDFVQKFYDENHGMSKSNGIAGFNRNYLMPIFRHHSHQSIPAIDRTMDADNEINGATNVTYYSLYSRNDIPKDLVDVMNFEHVKSECDAYHENVLQIAGDLNSDSDETVQNATEHLNRKKRDLSDWLIAPNTKWCGRDQTADKYSQLGGNSKADKCCRRHDHCKFKIYAMTTKWRLFNFRPFTISHCNCDTRRRRRDLRNLLRLPGTKWCGKGYSAKKYADLGGRSKADRCCRQHDKMCPYWIMGFETKYGLFNWRINTLMHCKCDDRFRTCLKMADSSDATMVGKLFFNIVQTKCFVLKPEKFCKKHSWWGTCEVEGVRKRAYLRDNKKF